MNDVFSLRGFDWVAFSSFLAAVSLLAGFLGWVVRLMIARNFVSHRDHQALGGRLSELEDRLDLVVTKGEMAEVQGRLRQMETSVAVQAADLQAIKEIGQRTEHMVTMLFDNALNREKTP